jgi:hypothetical protein
LTSTRDHAFLGRIVLATLALTLAAVGGQVRPVIFVAVAAIAVLGQLLLEAFSDRAGAATILDPASAGRSHTTVRENPTRRRL